MLCCALETFLVFFCKVPTTINRIHADDHLISVFGRCVYKYLYFLLTLIWISFIFRFGETGVAHEPKGRTDEEEKEVGGGRAEGGAEKDGEVAAQCHIPRWSLAERCLRPNFGLRGQSSVEISNLL